MGCGEQPVIGVVVIGLRRDRRGLVVIGVVIGVAVTGLRRGAGFPEIVETRSRLGGRRWLVFARDTIIVVRVTRARRGGRRWRGFAREIRVVRVTRGSGAERRRRVFLERMMVVVVVVMPPRTVMMVVGVMVPGLGLRG